MEGVEVFSLQKEPGGPETAPPAGLGIIDTGEAPLTETAAMIAGLDLVITSDTAIAHLAGALGRPTWLCIHHAPDWRWLLEREDNPWYPTLRLFRQSSSGDWTGVIAALAEALAPQVAKRAGEG
jgi:ADP-heptose:LPS heptosyltransferase